MVTIMDATRKGKRSIMRKREDRRRKRMRKEVVFGYGENGTVIGFYVRLKDKEKMSKRRDEQITTSPSSD